MQGKSPLKLIVICLWLVVSGAAAQTAKVSAIGWKDCLKQKPDWYGGSEAIRIAGNVLLYQRNSGGWPKNLEMAATLGEKEKAELLKQKSEIDSTIDNDATCAQLAYLARVFNATQESRFKGAFIHGLDYLLKAQYANGGWPQYYPKLTGYYTHITFNDDAMINVMTLLGEIARKQLAYGFVDEARRAKAGKAVENGIECILKCQIKVNGKLTAWCAQHDEVTFAPAPARTYEKISLSGSESIGIVRFLMSVDRPDARVVDAIQSAVAWFNQSKLTGIKVTRKPDAAQAKGYDIVVVEDAKAEPLWARFYEIGTNRPIFCGRDGQIKSTLAEIEYERRTGYGWYTDAPAKLLSQDYPAWLKRRAK
ncbi:MAG: pectate lyase [Acidobacteriota bacterium]|nr:pectate lyase [Acidobacteriota bacterium]